MSNAVSLLSLRFVPGQRIRAKRRHTGSLVPACTQESSFVRARAVSDAEPLLSLRSAPAPFGFSGADEDASLLEAEDLDQSAPLHCIKSVPALSEDEAFGARHRRVAARTSGQFAATAAGGHRLSHDISGGLRRNHPRVERLLTRLSQQHLGATEVGKAVGSGGNRAV